MQEKQLDDLDLAFGDVGGIELPDFDINLVDFMPADGAEETRYTLPKVVSMPSEYVCYDNAERMAKELRLDFGQRFDAFVSGNFIFGDFIEAYMVAHNVKAKKMTISTLSLSQENVDSLVNLLQFGFVDELNLIVSVYFWGNERNVLIPYIYEKLDIGNRFQMAVAGIHTKTCQFETEGGRKIAMHGSANLRSSGNVEQFTMEENPELYDFYDEKFSLILEKYGTIRKAIRRQKLWNEITKKNFDMTQKTSQTGSDRGDKTTLKRSTKASSRRNDYKNKIKGASTRTEAGVPY